MRFLIQTAVALSAFVASSQAAENLATGEVVDRTALRVCADPADFPFSDEAGQGFENEIAALMANHMSRELTYTWYPRTIGFVRQTLRSRLCDLVMGVVSANELMQNTNPYYRSTYVMAVRDEDKERFQDLGSPDLREAAIGVVAGTPPANLLATRGLLVNTRPYALHHDSRHERPIKQMIEDLAAGTIDVAMAWGPPVGYWANQSDQPMHLSALFSDDKRLRMEFRISMGVRWGEPDWKHEINAVIAELQPEITKVLQKYHVPLLDDNGQLISGVAEVIVNKQTQVARTRTAEAPPVPEPDGYRMERYRARVPSTLSGGTVLDTLALQNLIANENPVLIDVLPKQRRPKRQNNAIWMERKRSHLPGSVWLPNVGFGELSSEFTDYFVTNLDELSGGDKAKPLVFYCDENCWMSYNAAKRAMTELGYSQVYWYPDGVQGWQAAGLELVEGQEEPMPDFVR